MRAGALCGVLLLSSRASALDNGLGLVPPLAFSTWNFFVRAQLRAQCRCPCLPCRRSGCCRRCAADTASLWRPTPQNDAINDTLIRELGDALVSTGLAEVGYRTLNIDAGYLINERHPDTQELQVNATKFPNGIRPLADYLDAKGIGLGVYTDHGNGSCGIGPGSWLVLTAPPVRCFYITHLISN